MIAYEKAIVKQNQARFAKKIIDQAFCEFVENLTEYLNSSGYIEESKDLKFDTIDSCINHLSDNLIRAGIWNEDEKPIINPTETENVLMEVQVLNCSYQQECQWALQEPKFKENEQYRCQRLGCCVGAVKKYISEDSLPKSNQEKLNYSMTTVMDTQEGCKCQGFIFINDNFRRKELLTKYPIKFPLS